MQRSERKAPANVESTADKDAKNLRCERPRQEDSAMSFCPICKGNHDPDVSCGDLSGRILKGAGIQKRSTVSQKEFRETVRKANRWLLIILLAFAAMGALAIWIASRTAYHFAM